MTNIPVDEVAHAVLGMIAAYRNGDVSAAADITVDLAKQHPADALACCTAVAAAAIGLVVESGVDVDAYLASRVPSMAEALTAGPCWERP